MAHRPALVNYANGIVGDMARAEDVVQEAWVRFDAIAKGRPLDEPVGYLYRIVRNLAIDTYRGRLREGRVLEPGVEEAAQRTPDDTPSPEASVSAKHELQRLTDVLAELPERTRIALEMRRFGGCKLKEIADHLGISVTTAHDIIADGIDYCRQRVRPDS